LFGGLYELLHCWAFPGGRGTTKTPSRVEIKLSPSGDKMYSSDSFWLNAEVLDSDGVLPLDARSCPDLFSSYSSGEGYRYISGVALAVRNKSASCESGARLSISDSYKELGCTDAGRFDTG